METKSEGNTRERGRMALLVPWGYIHSASRDRRDGAKLMLPQQARQT